MEVKIDADNSEYIAQLQAEKDNLEASFTNAQKLISDGKNRVLIVEFGKWNVSVCQNGGGIWTKKRKKRVENGFRL